MFKISYYYNPVVETLEDGKMSISIYVSNGNRTKHENSIIDNDYRDLLCKAYNYVSCKNHNIESSFLQRVKEIKNLYI